LSLLRTTGKGTQEAGRQGAAHVRGGFFATFWLLLALLLPGWAQAQRFDIPQFVVVDYHAISKTRVADSPDHKPLYDYVYRVDVRNSGARSVNVTGQATSKRKSVVLLDNAVTFGVVDAHKIKTSEDTITVRAGKFFDRRLDRKLQVNGRWRFEEEGFDPEDQGLASLPQRSSHLLPELLDAIYNLKFAMVFSWNIRSQPDATAPTIDNTSPQGVLRDSRPLISASYADVGGSIATSGVVMTVDGVNITSQATVSASSISYRPATSLTDGAHTIALRVPDNAGNVGTASWTFTTDTQAPAISDPAPFEVLSASPGVAISARFADQASGVDVTRVLLTVDGQDVTALARVDATGVVYQAPSPLAAGGHMVHLTLADTAGNAAELQWSFSVDASGPEIAGLVPANGTELAADVLPTVSATFLDGGSGVDISNVRMLIDGADVTSQAQLSASGVSYTASTALAEGNHEVQVSAADVNGNTTEAIWAFVTRTAPEILNPQPSDAILNATSTVVISAQYRDVGSGIDTSSVRVSIDGVDFTEQAQINANGVTLAPTAALPQGLHIVSLEVRDLAGNITASQWRFTIDTGLPYVDEQQPRNTLVATPLPTISAVYADTGSASAATGVEHALTRLYVNGVDVTTQSQIETGASPHRISYTPATALSSGNQVVRLVVVDRAGNEIESVWNFTVDVDGPVITDVVPSDGATVAADALISISGTFLDAGSGIDVASVRIQLDGQDIAAQSAVTSNGFTRTFTQPLREGSHQLRISIRDMAGNETSRETVFASASAPVVSDPSPRDTFLPGGAQPTITAQLSDIGSGIDVTSVRVFFNGTDVTTAAQITAAALSYAVPSPLADRTHVVRVVVRDLAGNSTESSWEFGTATAPEITSMQPRDVLLPPGSRPVISAAFGDARVGIHPQTVHLLVNGVEVTAQASVSASGITYQPSEPLPAGPYTVYLEVGNQTTAVADAAWGFDVDSEKTYDVRITNPGGAITIDKPRLEVSAVAHSNKAAATSVSINSHPMRLTSVDEEGVAVYVGTVDLQDGVNSLLVRAQFDDGEVRTATREVTFDAPPRVIVTSPADRAVLGRANATSPGDLTGNVERPVTISGRVTKPVVSVQINQQGAQLLAGGTEFRFDNYFLREGVNVISVVATDANGRVGSAALTVSVDQTGPILTIEAPLTDAMTSASTIDVRGMVNDAVEGLIGAPEPTVTVNGQPAQVFDRYYLAANIPLQIGENELTVIATDQFGNSRTRTMHVSRIAVGSSRLTMLSGNHQQAAAVSELSQPLRVVALNAQGQPLPDLPLQFDVMRGTGSISTQQGQPTSANGMTAARNLIVSTDAQGQAQVWFTIGKQSGPGANVVKVSHPEIAEEVTFVATTQRGAVYKVSADTGINQFAETGSQPLDLLSIVIRDREDNVLPNVPVKFSVAVGDAFFTDVSGNRVDSVVMHTDKNGLTALRPTMGVTPGLVRITARALRDHGGDINNPADLIGDANYLITVKEARDGPATFKGFIYTDKGEPLPGVRVSIGRTSLSATSDATGAFELSEVPPGRIDLFVDGRTSSHQQKVWPSLHFESFVVRGQENQLAHPIYLPPLLMSEAKIVGGDEDVILTIPGLQGFQMKVKANSVTFPDGSRTGTLVVSPVTADRLPMAPPSGGALFGVPAWTIQPAGTRFDPPIEVQLPNATAQPAGDNLPIVQWDHDLGQFVPMGRATVSEDGAVLITDAGSGVTKAGWGGVCVYDPNKCGTDKPPECPCGKLDAAECPKCVPDPEKDGQLVSGLQPTVLNISWNSSSWKIYESSVLSKLAKFGGLEIGVKGKIGGFIRIADICCSSHDGDVLSAKATLAGDLEVEAKWNWLKGSKLVNEFTGDATDLGAYTKLKLFGGLGTGGELNWDDCQKQGAGKLLYSFGASLSLIDASLKTEMPINGKDVKVEFTAIDTGLTYAHGGALTPASARAANDIGNWNLTFFFKFGEYKFGDFKFSLINVSYSGSGVVHEVTQFATQ
jgi:hypothetical protein